MKFIVSLSDFQNTLQKVLPAIPRKSTLPVLEHLYFKLNGPMLEIIATDQDITIKTTLSVVGEIDGAILVPGRKLNDIVKALDYDGDIIFSSDDETFDTVISTNSGSYKMKGLSHEEYLNIPELFKESSSNDNPNIPDEAIFLKRDDIMKIANKTVFAVSKDEFRPAMNGVFFQFLGDKLNAVSTDSFRMVKINLEDPDYTFPADLNLIIPARSLDVLKKIDEDVNMSIIGNADKTTHVRFEIGSTVFVSKVIDEKFPPYEAVIPEFNKFYTVFNQKEFISALKRVSIFSSSISHQVRLHIADNKINLIAIDEDSGAKGQDTIECEYQGDEIEMAFNHRYLDEVLQNLDLDAEELFIKMSFTDSAKPVIIEPTKLDNNILMLIMPVRL